MTRIILYIDAILVYYFFEPILHLFQKIIKRDNFWMAEKFIIVGNAFFAGYSVALIGSSDFIGVGVLFFCISVLMLLLVSQHTWKFLMKWIGHPHRRSQLQKERDRGKYFTMHHKENPAMINLRSDRLRKWIFLCVIWVMWVGVWRGDHFFGLALQILFWYTLMITIWLYMRSITPLAGLKREEKTKKDKYLTSIFLF